MSMERMIASLYPIVQDLTDAEYGCCCCDADAATTTLCSFSLEELAVPVIYPRQLPEMEVSPSSSLSVSSSSSFPPKQGQREQNGRGEENLQQLQPDELLCNQHHSRRHTLFGIQYGKSLMDEEDTSNGHRRTQSSPNTISESTSRRNTVYACSRPLDDGTASINITTAVTKFDERYVLTRQMLRCNISTVWECIHRASGSRYCVKVIDRRRFSSPADESSTLREIRILETLREQQLKSNPPSPSRPRWVELVEVLHRDPHLVYIVTKNVPRGSLLSRLHQLEQTKELLTEAFVKQVARSILEGVHLLHSLSICHHDLRPEHILLLDDQGQIQICDFGSSVRLLDDEQSTSIFTSCTCHRGSSQRQRRRFESGGTAIQQLQYTAPELLEGRPHGTVSDLWAVGVILFYCLSGHLPFSLGDTANNVSADSSNSGSRRALRERIINADYSFSDREWAFVSRPAKQLISNLLQADPQVRMTALEALDHSWFVSSSSQPSSPTMLSSSKHRKRRCSSLVQRLFKTLASTPQNKKTIDKNVEDHSVYSLSTTYSVGSVSEESLLRKSHRTTHRSSSI